MSSIGVALATSATQIKVEVVARTLLHEGAIVRIKVPEGVSKGTYENDTVSVPFLRFAINITGGVVNVFVHTNDDTLRGKTIIAKVVVVEKALANGLKYLYVDLLPVDETTPVTHRLSVMPGSNWSGPDYIIFHTPAPLEGRGVVMLTPPKAKLAPGGGNLAASSAPTREPVAPPPTQASTGDNQLNRLLAEGWRIESETPTQVNLYKVVGGKKKTMIHCRPKKQLQGRRR